MPVPPVKAFEYSLLVEVKYIDHDTWETAHDYESAYTAADAITQAELRWKYKDRCEKAYVCNVQPRHT
jgi:hypothetical protein